MKEQLIRLKDRLNDLSLRNRSIRLVRINQKWGMDLLQLDAIRGEGTAQKILDGVMTRRQKVSLLRVTSDDPQAHALSRSLTTLYRNHRQIEEESGLYDLYVGYPFLCGTLSDGVNETYIQAPLFLYPVRLERQDTSNRLWDLYRGEGEPQLNRPLILAFRKFHQFQVDESIYTEAEEQARKGELETWVSWLKRYGLNLSFERSALKPLSLYRADEIPTNMPLGLYRYAVLGNFPQGNSAILRDYDEMIEDKEDSLGIVAELLDAGEERGEEATGQETSEAKESAALPEKERIYLLPTDSSQERILQEARLKKKLVIDGPPGTGKSQVIVNLISDALAQGKKILVVCQKRAALDVVYQRLEGLQLAHYAALVHDEKSDRRNVYARIHDLLSTSRNMEGEPDVHLESVCRRLTDHEAKLNTIKQGLYERHRCDYNAFELYSRAKPFDQVEETVDLSGVLQELDRHNLEDVLREVGIYASYYARFGRETYPLRKRKSFAEADMQTLSFMRERLEETLTKAQQTERYLESLPHEKLTPAYTWLVSKRLEKIVPELNAEEKNVIQKMRLWWWTSFTGKKVIAEVIQGEKFAGIDSTAWPQIRESLRILYEMAQTTEAMGQELEKLRPYLQDETIDRLKKEIGEGAIPTQWLLCLSEHLVSDFDDLREMDRFLAQASPLVQTLISRVEARIGWREGDLALIWTDAIRQTAYMQWIDEIERKHPLIAKVSSAEFEEIRRSYQALIQEKRRVANQVLIHGLQQTVNRIETEKPRACKELLHQVSKKRQIWPLRRLVRHFSQSGLLDLIPVWLTSPETLSSIFPLEQELFDVVIFDEASQCTVENGIPAIYRGKQVIVAGDEKQLPPSTLFQGRVELDEEEEAQFEMEESDSLLNLAKRIFPGQMLQWHYRSYSQELIHFSNHAFYRGMMEVAPNVRPYQQPPAIQWTKVNGQFINQQNEREANVVVDLLKEQFQSAPEESVGIITFNAPQRDRIEELIDSHVEKDPEFAGFYQTMQKQDPDRRLFVKNIENVQGDERDVIIFSVGYAPNEEGQVRAHFGSLSQQGGENRLNVAITRAKKRIRVVSSINPHELKVSHTKNRGPKLFRHYLEYAEAVSKMERKRVDAIIARIHERQSLGRQESAGSFDSIFEQQVCNALMNRGYQVDTQVGVSGYRIDLAIVHPQDPERYLLGIECDGAMYHSSSDARERDVYRQEFLEAKGWTITRIWSRNWWRNPAREMERIDHTIKRMLQQETGQHRDGSLTEEKPEDLSLIET
ncbi:AAA domain-containing protein [Desmospora activa]|uniref:Uncharacterized protein DUF559 n=1 Tax=Desmospora activa DSM 45169 TaxID=1121389 RepID=A0A2T4ZD86_9BACL|nr:AAA domain-containing protein [Desmospora activa]PTM59855.1 uncharacterized protein DUF559 [Desmospora activa DSM 45169]